MSHSHADGPAPDVAIVHHKTGKKILVLAGSSPSLVQRNTYHFIARAHGAIP